MSRAGTVRSVAVLGAALAYPFVVNAFWVSHVAGQTFALGTVALSLVFLAAYAGIVSLAQLTVAGLSAYAYAYCTTPMSGAGPLLSWPAAVLAALGCAVAASVAIGCMALRTQGVYVLMMTLAVAMGAHALALQNYTVFRGYDGFTQVRVPDVLGVSLDRPEARYYLGLSVAALSCLAIRHLVATPFGLALRAMRDNPRRLAALGYSTDALRILAFAVSGLVAGLGGLLGVWLNGSISPGMIGLDAVIDVLIAAVLGGLSHPLGAYLGAFAFTVIQSFAIVLVAPERFNTVIGLVFIAVVVGSPDGIVGLWAAARRRLRRSEPAAAAGLEADRQDRQHLQQGGSTHGHATAIWISRVRGSLREGDPRTGRAGPHHPDRCAGDA